MLTMNADIDTVCSAFVWWEMQQICRRKAVAAVWLAVKQVVWVTPLFAAGNGTYSKSVANCRVLNRLASADAT